MVAALVGALLALAAGLLGTTSGMDRDRAFYPTVTIVIALLYVLFAVLGGSSSAVVAEAAAGAVFIAAAVAGFRSSLWIVAAALAGHGVFDLVHAAIIANPGVPTWWPAFCGTYDIVAGAYFAGILWTGRLAPAVRPAPLRSAV